MHIQGVGAVGCRHCCLLPRQSVGSTGYGRCCCLPSRGGAGTGCGHGSNRCGVMPCCCLPPSARSKPFHPSPPSQTPTSSRPGWAACPSPSPNPSRTVGALICPPPCPFPTHSSHHNRLTSWRQMCPASLRTAASLVYGRISKLGRIFSESIWRLPI